MPSSPNNKCCCFWRLFKIDLASHTKGVTANQQLSFNGAMQACQQVTAAQTLVTGRHDMPTQLITVADAGCKQKLLPLPLFGTRPKDTCHCKEGQHTCALQ